MAETTHKQETHTHVHAHTHTHTDTHRHTHAHTQVVQYFQRNTHRIQRYFTHKDSSFLFPL